MFVYPLLPGLLHPNPYAYGLWAGSSIYEIAQVGAASFQDGPKAGERPLLLGLAAFLFIAGFSLMLVKMTA
jgi:uncharacterized membrane protein YadS